MPRATIVFIATMFLGLLSCVTESKPENDFDLSPRQATPKKIVESVKMTGTTQYNYKEASFTAEWMACTLKSSKSTILVMNRDLAGFDSKTFCKGWIAQAALTQNKSVVAVNRPGYGDSTGDPDFAGPRSQAALIAGINASKQKIKNLPPIRTVWGYSSGATAAAVFARNNKTVQALILGGGIFDTEEALRTFKDSFMADSLKEAIENEGDSAHEFRSIAWDTSGLPKRIILYHGEKDQDIPADRARSFRDTLATASYEVDIQIISGLSHRINPTKHRSILEVLFKAAP